MQTPQTDQSIKQITSKTKILIFVKTGLLQYNTTNKGSRPEIQNDPGERGRGKKRADNLQHHQQGICSMSNVEAPSRYFRREMVTSENKTTRCSRGRTTAKTRSRDSASRCKS